MLLMLVLLRMWRLALVQLTERAVEQLGEDWRTTTRVINTMGMSPSLLYRIRVTVTVTVTVNQWAVMLMWAARLGSRQAAVARRSIWSLKAWTPCCNRPQCILERPRR